MLYTVYNELK